MFQNINLNFLKYYYEVANAKNITKASEILNISQPALTKAIKELENELNTTLLIRNKKGVVLTEQGKILYEYTKVMLQKLQTAISTIDNPKEYEKNIYIGTTTTNFLEPILPILKELKRKYSNIQIHIFLEEIDVLENYRKLGKMDIIIKNDYEVINNLEKIKSFSIQDSFIASRKDFPEHSAHQLSCHDVVLQPHTCRNMGGLGCSPFARHYWGNHCLFSFPAGTKMFQFPALAFHIVEWYLFKVPGCPIRKSADQRSFAPTRSLSQLITSFIASESQGIRHVPLLTFCLTDHVWSIYTFSF